MVVFLDIFRYKITTQKASGIISGTQKVAGGEIEWSDKLPEGIRLSQYVLLQQHSFVRLFFRPPACPSVRPSICLSVRPSVRPSFDHPLNRSAILLLSLCVFPSFRPSLIYSFILVVQRPERARDTDSCWHSGVRPGKNDDI